MGIESPIPYPFSYVGGTNNACEFSTANDIEYEIAFKPTPYGLGDELL